MVFAYRGWGAFLVPVIPLIFFAATFDAVGFAMHDTQYFEEHRWPRVVASLATAVILWLIGRWLNRPQPGEEIQVLGSESSIHDEQLARILRSRHSLFCIPVECWGLIIGFFGVVLSLAP
jgi:uncharacterized membrane protein